MICIQFFISTRKFFEYILPFFFVTIYMNICREILEGKNESNVPLFGDFLSNKIHKRTSLRTSQKLIAMD